MTWDLDSAKRIANAVRLVESNARIYQGIASQDIRPGMVASVRTPAVFPASYSGSAPVPGKCIEDRGDGEIVEICDCWIQERNDGILTTDTVYEGRMARVYAGDLGAAPLFKVQSSATASDYAATVYPWSYQWVYFEGADFPYPYQQKILIHVDSSKLFFTSYAANDYANLLPAAQESDNYYIMDYPDGMPIVSLNDFTFQNNVHSSWAQPEDLEDAFAKACSHFYRTVSIQSTFKQTTAYFLSPTSGKKIYLYRQAQHPKYETEWGYFRFHRALCASFILNSYCKRVTNSAGQNYVVLLNTFLKRSGAQGTFYMWFADPFNLFPTNTTSFGNFFSVMISPIASPTLQGAVVSPPRQNSSWFTSWAVTQIQHRTSPYNLPPPTSIV
jgi:hypothetical protein